MIVYWVSEYGRIYKGPETRPIGNGDLQLASHDFDSLLSIMEGSVAGGAHARPIFRYSRIKGQDVLAVQEYVGVIRTESGTDIEVLPKISREMDPMQAQHLAIKMLSKVAESPFLEVNLAQLSGHRMPLFEVILRQYLLHVGNIVRKGVARQYRTHQDNLRYLRGKLRMSEHIRRNSVDHSRAYCEYDSYEADRPINRVIRGALDITLSTTRSAENARLCRELLYWFDEVPPSRAVSTDLRSVRNDRLVQHYQPAMPLCRMIHERLNPLVGKGTRNVVALLFPLSRVFEEYVSVCLCRQLGSGRVRTQVRGKALVDHHVDRPCFRLIPDLAISTRLGRVIADTKWKVIDSRDRENNYGIVQSDVYQLFAYAKKYCAAQNCKHVWLIYPKTDSFRYPLPTFWYEEGREALHVIPFDIQQDALVRGLEVEGGDVPFESLEKVCRA